MLLLTPVCIFSSAYVGMYACDVDGRILLVLLLLASLPSHLLTSLPPHLASPKSGSRKSHACPLKRVCTCRGAAKGGLEAPGALFQARCAGAGLRTTGLARHPVDCHQCSRHALFSYTVHYLECPIAPSGRWSGLLAVCCMLYAVSVPRAASRASTTHHLLRYPHRMSISMWTNAPCLVAKAVHDHQAILGLIGSR